MGSFKEAGREYDAKSNIAVRYDASLYKKTYQKLTDDEQLRARELFARGYTRSQAYDIIEAKKRKRIT